MGLSPDSVTKARGGRRFDSQAATFDRRTGVPLAAAVDIAHSVLSHTHHPERPQVVLEVGAGTGEVGRHLAAGASRYAGMDISEPMLGVFKSKLADGTSPAGQPVLVLADADRAWPVRDDSVTVVFASRVVHLLGTGHVVSEVARVCARPGFLVVGRVERSGVKELLRQQREAMLAEWGITIGRSGLGRTQALLAAFVAKGAVVEPTRTVASWTGTTTTERVISGWDAMSTMGGEVVTPDIRIELLAQLRMWAFDHLGDPDRPQSFTEYYTVDCVQLG